MIDRRNVLVGVGSVGSLILPIGNLAATNTELSTAMTGRFERWLRVQQTIGGHGLLTYLGTSKNNRASSTLSLVASADTAIWAFNSGKHELGVNIADALTTWYLKLKADANKFTYGGFPTEIHLNPNLSWSSGSYFYASDNLLIIEVLYRAHLKTKNSKYAEVAIEVGNWLKQNLFDGKRYGVWAKNFGPPMAFMRSDGAVLNIIYTGVDYLWISSLNRLAELNTDRAWTQMFNEAIAFFDTAQSSHGCWYDHFKPDSYTSASGRWKWYREGQKTIGDNNLRAAFAAKKYGKVEQFKSFLRWLKPFESKFLWGYLDPATGGGKFLPQDTPYFDIVCTGMLAELYRQNGDKLGVQRCKSALFSLQNPDGGWHWGINARSRSPINSELATITGLWATGNCL